MSHHVSSAGFLWKIAGALFFLTVVTVAVTQIHIPSPFNVVVALLIAGLKAFLVAAYFMNLKWDEKFNTLLLVSAILFVCILFGITMLDTLTRPEVIPSF